MSVKHTGIVGLGAMGYQMARHMVNKGFDVAGYDVQAEMMTRAKAAGVKIVGSIADVGESAEIVIVMVATDKQVEDVVVNSGLLDRLKKGSVICISSSTSPETAQGDGSRSARNAASASSTRRSCSVRKPPTTARSRCFVAARPTPSRRRSPRSRRSAKGSCMSGPRAWASSPRPPTTCCCGPAWRPITRCSSFAKKMGADIPKLVEALQYLQRRQLVAGEMGPRHRQMGREGHGCGARSRPGREGARAALGPGRPAHEGHEPGQDAGPAAIAPAAHWRGARDEATMRLSARGGVVEVLAPEVLAFSALAAAVGMFSASARCRAGAAEADPAQSRL